MKLGDLVSFLDASYPPELAEDWDAVGLVCGDPETEVTSVMTCVDVTDDVAECAIAVGADVIVAHHPLLLKGVTNLSGPKGRILTRLITAGCGLYTAHTNADAAAGGVNDVLAARLGVVVFDGPNGVLKPAQTGQLDQWVVFVPVDAVKQVRAAMFAAGAGHIGKYSECAWKVMGEGQFRPLSGSNPAVGRIDEVERVDEIRLECVARRELRAQVLAALRFSHPFEEPAFSVLEIAATTTGEGLGRVGTLAAPLTLTEFAELVRARLPHCRNPIRVAGAPDKIVHTVALCSGSGESLLSSARKADADVFVTADLRHHPVDEHLRVSDMGVVDAGHWTTEFPWCESVADLLTAQDLDVVVFREPTDPWSIVG